MKTYIISGLTLASVLAPQLHSETYNVITVSRVCWAADYYVLADKAIDQIFDNLGNFLTIIKGESTSTSIFENKAQNVNKMIILFNESFFGQSTPIDETKLQYIQKKCLDTNKFDANTYLFVNFLYTEKNNQGDEAQRAQIDISKQQYSKIFSNGPETEPQPFFYAPNRNLSPDYLNQLKNGPCKEQSLFFNQTKIFNNGQEIGHYNKSSFCDELKKGNILGYYYVIGDFITHWNTQQPSLPIRCLTCYDATVLAYNKNYVPFPEQNTASYKIIMFPSNPYFSLPTDLRRNQKIQNEIQKYYICANGAQINEENPTGNDDEETIKEKIANINKKKNLSIEEEEEKPGDYEVTLNGIYRFAGGDWSIHKINDEFKITNPFTFKIPNENLGEDKQDLCTMKFFTLTPE